MDREMYDSVNKAIQFRAFDYTLLGITLFAIIISWSLVIANYAFLPDVIPIHYNGRGEADGFGNKQMIWLLPILNTIIPCFYIITHKNPQLINFPVKITPENAIHQYKNAYRLLRIIFTIASVGFLYITYISIWDAMGRTNGLSVYFMVIFVGSIITTIVFYFIKTRRER